MFPMSRFVSESAAADLLEQVRWRDGVECPRCRSDLTVRNGSYRVYQRYLCKNCGRTFNDKTGTIFAHSKLTLKEWYFAIYVFLRFNASLRQIEAELDLSYRTVRRRVERFARALDAPAIRLSGPVEIDEVYVSAGLKGRERDQESRSRWGSNRWSARLRTHRSRRPPRSSAPYCCTPSALQSPPSRRRRCSGGFSRRRWATGSASGRRSWDRPPSSRSRTSGTIRSARGTCS